MSESIASGQHSTKALSMTLTKTFVHLLFLLVQSNTVVRIYQNGMYILK